MINWMPMDGNSLPGLEDDFRGYLLIEYASGQLGIMNNVVTGQFWSLSEGEIVKFAKLDHLPYVPVKEFKISGNGKYIINRYPHHDSFYKQDYAYDVMLYLKDTFGIQPLSDNTVGDLFQIN